jgi:bifunctional non-homologous end joining protein LigD
VSTKPVMGTTATGRPRNRSWPEALKREIVASSFAPGSSVSVVARLFTRNRNDWSDRFPSVVEAVEELKLRSCLIDGEVVVCNERGLAVFDLLRHGHQVKREAHLIAFDLVELDGRDLTAKPLQLRKAELARIMRRRRRWPAALRAHRPARQCRVRARLPARLRGDREQAAGLALPAGPVEVHGLDQGEESGGASRATRSGRGLGQGAMTLTFKP